VLVEIEIEIRNSISYSWRKITESCPIFIFCYYYDYDLFM